MQTHTPRPKEKSIPAKTTAKACAARSALLDYYRANARDLPWRNRHDPYAIWVSEIMLQQTRVDTVRERYGPFLSEFPHLQSLAGASEERVCEAWAGLGYYHRARNLHRAGRVIARDLGGEWPRTASELARLPGVGAYTAGAIASIAFGEPVAAVDGNATRVLARMFALAGRAGDAGLRRRVQEIASLLADCPTPGDVNQALMDLGSAICTPAAPRCACCPLARLCAARRNGDPRAYPAPAPTPIPRQLAVAFAWIESSAGVYLRRRQLSGLWPGMWELPSATGPRARAALAADLGLTLGPRLAVVEHVLTHRRVRAAVYRACGRVRADAGLVAYRDPLGAALSALARKAISAVGRLGTGPSGAPGSSAGCGHSSSARSPGG